MVYVCFISTHLNLGLAASALLLCGGIVSSARAGSPQLAMQTLFTFTGDPAAPAWRAVNDGVMGGVSQGTARLTENGMRFEGTLSLDNNGGFASVRQPVQLDLSGYSAIRLKVRGDGRVYQLRLETDARYGWRGPVSFSGEFKTAANEWVEVSVRFADLDQTWRGQELSGYPFRADRIQLVGILLADKQPGPFQIEVAWIAATE